jgi:hypothetical protein
MTHKQLKEKHRQELSEFTGLFWAFNAEQFAEGVRTIGATSYSLLASIGAGGYILRERLPAFKEMLAQHAAETRQLNKDRKALLDGLVYELGNHEFCYTHDATDAARALGLELADIPADILAKAKSKALELARAFETV